MSEIVGHLVWLKNPMPRPGRAPMIAEKWPIEAAIAGKTPLAKHALNAEQWSMSILVLEQRFPAPQLPEVAS